jgi:hypothetical protein
VAPPFHCRVSFCVFAIKIKEMDEKSDKSWTRAKLMENVGRCGGRKQDLLDLAILYFDGVFVDFVSDLGANSTPATITEAQLTSERQICYF